MLEKKLLIIEDDEELGLLLDSSLKTSYEIANAKTGQEGLKTYESEHPDMVILDLNLPDVDGLDLCRDIRKNDDLTPIIIISSRKEEVDRILGLELGADDYISKPFSVRELRSRVHAFFRRAGAVEAAGVRSMEVAQSVATKRRTLRVDELAYIIQIDGRDIPLTHTEYQLLRLLAGAPGKVFSRNEIIQAIWGEEWTGTDTVMIQHFKRLRRKIETDPRQPECIQTIHGMGYRLNPQCEIVFY